MPSAGLQPQFVTPTHLFGFSLAHRYRAIGASFDLNHTGQYIAPVFPANLRFDGYTKADLFVSYERSLTERLVMTFVGGADNLFDARYFENGFARRESWRGAEFTYSSDDGSVLEKSRK